MAGKLNRQRPVTSREPRKDPITRYPSLVCLERGREAGGLNSEGRVTSTRGPVSPSFVIRHSSFIARDQPGVVYVSSLICLAALSFSVLALSALLLNEIKVARYVDNSIVSHYAAESGLERALWSLKMASRGGQPVLFFTGLPVGDPQNVADPADPERQYVFNKIEATSTDYVIYDLWQNDYAHACSSFLAL